MNDEEFLAHYGVRGMRWGVRRAAKIHAARQLRAKNASDEAKTAHEILRKQKKFGTSSLSNAELKTINARIKLEQEFHKAVPLPKSKLQKGKEFVDKVFSLDDKIRKFSNGKGIYDMVLKGHKAMTAKPAGLKSSGTNPYKNYTWTPPPAPTARPRTRRSGSGPTVTVNSRLVGTNQLNP